MTLINESQNTVSRNCPAGQLTYKRKEHIFIPLSLHLHLHYSLCTEETGTVAEWGCMFGNRMPGSEEPNAERVRVLSFNSMAP